jgi:hypothetical protein
MTVLYCVGISPNGFNRALSVVEPKVLNTYTTHNSVQALRSYAASVEDFWSVKGQHYMTIGGGRQLFTGNKNAIVPNNNLELPTLSQQRAFTELAVESRAELMSDFDKLYVIKISTEET